MIKMPGPGLPPLGPNLLSLKKTIETIFKIGKYAWGLITGKDGKQEEIAAQNAVNPEKSQANEIAELNKLLTEYRQNIISAGSSIEQEMIVECTMQMQEIMEVFEEYNQNLKISRSEPIKRKFRRLNDNLKGTFANYISKKVSLDDLDCVKILKLPAGELKEKRLQELKEKVFIAATNEMIDRIKDTVDDFLETVENSIHEHLDRTELTLEERSIAFENLDKAAEGDADSLESTILQAHYSLAICNYVSEL